MNVFLDVIQNRYATFRGRATRQEYWMFVLVSVLIAFALALVAQMTNAITAQIFGGFYALAIFIPLYCAKVRRLHDQKKSGWWILINLVPLVGGIFGLILMVTDGTHGPNLYGPDPKGREAEVPTSP